MWQELLPDWWKKLRKRNALSRLRDLPRLFCTSCGASPTAIRWRGAYRECMACHSKNEVVKYAAFT